MLLRKSALEKKRKFILDCNTSPYGARAVHVMDDGEERPIHTHTHAKNISRDTRRDPVIGRVLEFALAGWSNYVSDEKQKLYFTYSGPRMCPMGNACNHFTIVKEQTIARVT